MFQLRKTPERDTFEKKRRNDTVTNIESVVNTIMEDMSKMSFFLPHQNSSSIEETNTTKRAKRSWTSKRSILNQEEELSTEENTCENYKSERRSEYKYVK